MSNCRCINVVSQRMAKMGAMMKIVKRRRHIRMPIVGDDNNMTLSSTSGRKSWVN